MVRYTGITLYQVDWQGKRQGNFALCEAEERGATETGKAGGASYDPGPSVAT